jgi:hypothetical protein
MVGPNSIKFIAHFAREGWSDEEIQSLYRFALSDGALHSVNHLRWFKTFDRWNEQRKADGNRQGHPRP